MEVLEPTSLHLSHRNNNNNRSSENKCRAHCLSYYSSNYIGGVNVTKYDNKCNFSIRTTAAVRFYETPDPFCSVVMLSVEKRKRFLTAVVAQIVGFVYCLLNVLFLLSKWLTLRFYHRKEFRRKAWCLRLANLFRNSSLSVRCGFV